ncbi:hypothetical protein GF359_07090, partial [candidate division WOR-3 bacterium]|nr:hypothetical protein [candidate division WOR-3 bacterium]MBD3364964.1 hypothetical protein [candidate division WOR-3 bacterium]
MKRILSISPWPSVWSQGEEGGSPSEAYAIRAMQEAEFAVTHLSPLASGLPAREESEGMEIVRIANPFRRYRFIFKSGIAFLYRLPAIMEWTRLVSTWLRKSGRRYDLIIGHS